MRSAQRGRRAFSQSEDFANTLGRLLVISKEGRTKFLFDTTMALARGARNRGAKVFDGCRGAGHF